MTELTKLSPELEGNIATYEQFDIVVEDAGDREEAIVVIKSVKTIRANVVAFFKPQKDAINKAKEELMKIINPLTGRCDVIEVKFKKEVTDWDDKQKVIREKEQARLQAVEDARARKEQERLIKQAEKIKTPERSEALLEEAASIVAPVIQVAGPEKNKGEATKKNWKYRVINIDKVPRDWWILDDKGLSAFAKATKGNKKIEGIEIYSESILAIAI